MRHMGELLTVTALGGACFGLPTTMVSERERGVWRRYRLTPVLDGDARRRHGRRALRHLLVARDCCSSCSRWRSACRCRSIRSSSGWRSRSCRFAFIGLGLVIAMMADNVPAVQALGQCIFLPMLIIGGVAVPLASLPDWAQRLSAFFPGRYAVEALQACVTGDGLRRRRLQRARARC